MRHKITIISYAVIIGVILIFLNSCKKDDPKNAPLLITAQVTEVTQTTAISGGNVSDDGGAPVTARGVCWGTTQAPTINDNKTTNGSGTGSFTSSITGLGDNTTYYVRAYATNSVGTSYGNEIFFKTEPASFGSFTDSRDNNVYKFLTIGEQVWMAENLKYLPTVVPGQTSSETTPHYYVYNYDGTIVADAKATENYKAYGVLYNIAAALAGSKGSDTNPSGVQGVCPAGWHLPSKKEWTELVDFLGGETVAGGKLKEEGTTHWYSPNLGATNESGFTALGGGSRRDDRSFLDLRHTAYFWSATRFDPQRNLYWLQYIQGAYTLASQMFINSNTGAFSVRCVRD